MAVTAADIMTAPAVIVGPTASVAEIAGLLSSRHISAVPVCNPDGRLAGIVSEGDILRPFHASAVARRKWWLDSWPPEKIFRRTFSTTSGSTRAPRPT